VPASAIILVRHAEAVPAEVGGSNTADNDRPLSTKGQMAARTLVVDLEREHIGAVFSSPYLRALATVEPIATDRGVAVRVEPDLRERRLAAAPLSDMQFLDALRRSRIDPAFALPGGESTNQVLQRAVRVLRRMDEATPTGIALAATHGGFISILRWHLGEEFTVEEALAEPMPAIYRLPPLETILTSFG
jgi:2,3-bisphosphoglycerate-dependent phosphoglycerate mutase